MHRRQLLAVFGTGGLVGGSGCLWFEDEPIGFFIQLLNETGDIQALTVTVISNSTGDTVYEQNFAVGMHAQTRIGQLELDPGTDYYVEIDRQDGGVTTFDISLDEAYTRRLDVLLQEDGQTEFSQSEQD